MATRTGVRVTAATKPMANEPSTLISSVPQGNRGPVTAAIAAVSQNLARLPNAPPKATASKVVGDPMRRPIAAIADLHEAAAQDWSALRLRAHPPCTARIGNRLARLS